MSDLCVTPKKRAPGRGTIYNLPTEVTHPTRRRAVNHAEHPKPKIGGGGKSGSETGGSPARPPNQR